MPRANDVVFSAEGCCERIRADVQAAVRAALVEIWPPVWKRPAGVYTWPRGKTCEPVHLPKHFQEGGL